MNKTISQPLADGTNSKPEPYYTAELYEIRGIMPFLEHIEQYLSGDRTVPVIRTEDHTSRTNQNSDVFCTFSDDLMRLFLDEKNGLEKPYEVALKYGFRGFSRGGRNGIFYQRKKDDGMKGVTDSLMLKNTEMLSLDLDVPIDHLDELKKVKIVWHNPQGPRVVGAYNTIKQRIVFLDFANY
tara:strand:+ start:7347 stop:7892 length:546 start_codon:yes stop_codon:yes gene_type:complete